MIMRQPQRASSTCQKVAKSRSKRAKAQKKLKVLNSADHYELLSNNFLSLVRTLGEAVSGDEKLLHFTGNSGHIIALKQNQIVWDFGFTSLWVVWRTDSSMIFIR